jgi:cellulose biosynthesis protein BcsQ
VLSVASNKGGVGKTTVATNLAIYLRALHEELPVLLVGLDDQSVIDRMFRLGGSGPGERNLKHGWAGRSFDGVMRMGQYGIHYVPPPPDTAALKARAEDPRILGRILEHTSFDGLVILDTKSDLEALTLNALAAADLSILPVSDFASLEEAAKAFDRLARLHPGASRGRVLFTLVDRRTRVDASGRDLHDRLVEAVEVRGWPRFQTVLSRSPRVESLNSASGSPGSVLHHARGSVVHRQFRELAEEVGKALDLGPAARRAAPPPAAAPAPRGGGLRDALLRGLSRRVPRDEEGRRR